MTETKMQLEDWLDDLCVRFIINLPREELESVERICFQVEEAQWFYEDFIRPLDPNLPSLSLRAFALRIFQHCPLMSQWSHHHHSAAFSEFLAYKTRVPVRGAILLNHAMDEVVLVKGWKKGANWSFPRGKINKDEKDLDCAVREVYEETGFDIKLAGLLQDEKNTKHIEIPMREQNMRLYVLRGVPMDTHFEPRTRKEISKIEWYKLSDLPTLKKNRQVADGDRPDLNGNAGLNANKFYMVAPFLGPLKKWIGKQKKLDAAKGSSLNPVAQAEAVAEIITEDEATGIEEHPSFINGRPARMPGISEVHPESQQPSDLPEVSELQDPSAHLKRLLNVGNDTHVLPQQQQQQPFAQTQQHDSTKGNALLELLRRGSETNIPENRPIASSPFHPNKAAPIARSQHFPQPHISPQKPALNPIGTAAPVPSMGHGQPHMGHMQNPVQFQNIPRQAGPYVDGRAYPNLPQPTNITGHFPQQSLPRPANVTNPHYQPVGHGSSQNLPLQNERIPPAAHDMSAFTPSRERTPAPYQRTGDPEFASATQFPNLHMPSIPPANTLPLPKLSNHSLSLLSVFKDGNSKKAEPTSQELSSQSVEATVGSGPKSYHQDNLLNLLKKPNGSVSRKPDTRMPQDHAELETQNTPSPMNKNFQPAKNTSKERVKTPMILQNPSKPTSGRTAARKTSATLPGPFNLPNFEGITKGSPKRSPVPSPRAPQKDQPVQMSNVTILPRPVSNKNDSAPVPDSTAKLASPTPRKPNVKISELSKPFKPKILRRPDRDDLDASLPTRTVTVSAFSKPGDNTVSEEEQQQQQQQEKPKHVNYDRRPSQSAGQKDALLSLFGKGPTSSSLPTTGGKAETSPPLKSPAAGSPHYSSVISPLDTTETQSSSSNQAAASGSSKKPGQNKVTSPVDKAFLLGYLEGVAKGEK